MFIIVININKFIFQDNQSREYIEFDVTLTKIQIDSLENMPGSVDFDKKYISLLLRCLFSSEQLLKSSLTGLPTKNRKQKHSGTNKLDENLISFMKS